MTDKYQQKIIELIGQTALVLAGPGCGKTHILAQRILYAHTVYKVPFEQMLCLTFTNRAAREMNSRIKSQLGYLPCELFIGNIHRFCLRFLYANNLISQQTSILDEEEQRDFFAEVLGINTDADAAKFQKVLLFLDQTEQDHPAHLIHKPPYPIGENEYARVKQYKNFKEQNNFIDFDEILTRTYTALLSSSYTDCVMSRFSWIQVDEVQDMTPLQLAITDRLSGGHNKTKLFLGDEQQAIFSFTGAGGVALDHIKAQCIGHIYHLQRNYRSPNYLVSLCNEIAENFLGIDSEFLPVAEYYKIHSEALISLDTHSENLPLAVSALAKKWLCENSDENVAILTRTNLEGEKIADILESRNIDHIRFSRKDLFHQAAFKTLYAHIAVILNPDMLSQWIRLFYQLATVRTLSVARDLVKRLRNTALSPLDMMNIDQPSLIERFYTTFYAADKTIAVIDTETTGLDIFNDDIIQIAAVKMRNGKIIEGSNFEIYIKTSRAIPKELKNGVQNPLLELADKVKWVDATEAFHIFADYLSDCSAIAGHNSDFDISILQNNLQRLGEELSVDLLDIETSHFDTLSISKRVFPQFKSHSLEALIEQLQLKGQNSHNATDDVSATVELIGRLLDAIPDKLKKAEALKKNAAFQRVCQRLAQRYKEFYDNCRARLFCREIYSLNTLAGTLEEAYNFFNANKYISNIHHIDYLLKLIDTIVVNSDNEPRLREQTTKHFYELLTFNESDLYLNDIIKERLSVMTIHKAKGLEFDNVIVCDTANFKGSSEEKARLFYVAFSRSKKRLCAIGSGYADPIFQHVSHHFHKLSSTDSSLQIFSHNNTTVKK